jgi:long-subunit acyl-CoA synthetase (AMP-forming)
LCTVEELNQLPETSAAAENLAGRPCFLQFTSGSTSPKGVMVTHANLVDTCAWAEWR